jgi:hypothetical protein
VTHTGKARRGEQSPGLKLFFTAASANQTKGEIDMGSRSRSLLCVLAFMALIPIRAIKAQTPDASKIIDLVGTKFTKVFSTLGTPTDPYTIRASTESDDYVVLDYPTFAFKVRNKIATMGIFWKEYDGSVNGVRIGDKKSSVLDKLGNTDDISKNADGSVNYFWQQNDYYLGVVFDDDNGVTMIKIETK